MTAVVVGVLVLLAMGVVRSTVAAGRRGCAQDRLGPLRNEPAGRRHQNGISSPPAPRRLVDACRDADLEPVPPWLWPGWPAAAIAGLAVTTLVAGPGAGMVALLAAGAAPPAALLALGDRAERRLERQLPHVLETAARSLRAGAGFRQALADGAAAEPGPAGRAVQAVVDAAERGAPLVAELDRWAARQPLPAVQLAVAALALGATTGGAQARAVDGVAATLRDRTAVDEEIRALATQARASALVMVVAPIAFAALAVASDPAAATFLLRRPLGLACLTAGLVLDAVGAWWMHRITAGVLR